jgi:hypothetical protein
MRSKLQARVTKEKFDWRFATSRNGKHDCMVCGIRCSNRDMKCVFCRQREKKIAKLENKLIVSARRRR